MEELPPPPPILSLNVKPQVVALAPPKHSIMSRPRGSGTTGRRIALSTNHFKVSVNNPDAVFYQYCVCLPHPHVTFFNYMEFMYSVPCDNVILFCRFL